MRLRRAPEAELAGGWVPLGACKCVCACVCALLLVEVMSAAGGRLCGKPGCEDETRRDSLVDQLKVDPLFPPSKLLRSW